MDIADFLTPDRVVLDLRVRDKPALILELARRAAGGGVTPDAVAAALHQREELGSTGLGKGFALPHARLAATPRPFGLFVRLFRPIGYAAIDEAPVDLVFLLLLPRDEQANGGSSPVSALAAVARRFRDEDTAIRVRRAATPAAVFEVLAAR